MEMGEKIIIKLLVHVLKMLIAIRWEKNGGDFTKAESDINQAEAYLRATE